jgi:hypothetical protein
MRAESSDIETLSSLCSGKPAAAAAAAWLWKLADSPVGLRARSLALDRVRDLKSGSDAIVAALEHLDEIGPGLAFRAADPFVVSAAWPRAFASAEEAASAARYLSFFQDPKGPEVSLPEMLLNTFNKTPIAWSGHARIVASYEAECDRDWGLHRRIRTSARPCPSIWPE